MMKNVFGTRLAAMIFSGLVVLALIAGPAFSAPVSAAEKSDRLGDTYEYRLEDGRLKYCLDLGGDDVRLHCWFRTGDPNFEEEVYTLPMDEMTALKDTLIFTGVKNGRGIDIGSQFAFLAVTFKNQKAVLSVVRDEKTLAGGPEGSIMTGTYEMAVKSGADAKKAGKCLPSILCRMAQSYYSRRNGFYPPIADYTENGDGTYKIHLYEIVDEDVAPHTATSAWYTVDAGGVGSDDILGGPINIRE